MSVSHGYYNSLLHLCSLVLHAFGSKAHTRLQFMPILLPPTVRPITSLADCQSSLETLMERVGDIILTCSSEGNPAPSFTWMRDGVLLSSNLYTDTSLTNPTVTYPWYVSTNGMTTSVLTISGAVYPEDDGVYECIGTNSHAGIDNSSGASITVTGQGTIALSAFEV